MSKQLTELTTEVKILKDEVKTLKDTLNSQNLTILKLLEDQKQLISNLTDASSKIPLLPKNTSVFPLENIQQLESFEASLNDDNLMNHIETMRILIGDVGLRKNLRAILKAELIMEVNVRGLGNKVSLSSYKKFMNALYQASYTGEEWTQSHFLNELRQSLKLNKNRIYKFRMEKKVTENPQGQVRFEEIFFSEDEEERQK